ncbi:MAG: AMP-binding protein, partial [Acidimicrobiia bacterium]|nr:AMP-binding protein [Acidimicrobiia bacterium]
WNRPEATAAAFDGGWFRTGDVAVDDGDDGWRLLGRASVDILKSGGEKVSALEIEAAYRDHPAIDDCAVVGLPDDEWGQRVAMAWTPTPGHAGVDGGVLRTWGKERLAAAKVPVVYLQVDELPRNALGKVTKPAVVDLFGPSGGA